MAGSLKILSLQSFCYFLIWTSNLSLKACCCYRQRPFLLRVFGIYVPTYVYHLGYIYILYAFMFSLTNISGTVCSKKMHFEYIFKKSINLSCLSLETSANLVMSRAIYPYLVTRSRCKTRHIGRIKCNRSFHSRKLAGVFGRKKSCVRVNLIT